MKKKARLAECPEYVEEERDIEESNKSAAKRKVFSRLRTAVKSASLWLYSGAKRVGKRLWRYLKQAGSSVWYFIHKTTKRIEVRTRRLLVCLLLNRRRKLVTISFLAGITIILLLFGGTTLYKETVYRTGAALLSHGDFESAAAKLEKISGYKDTDEYIHLCKQHAVYEQAVALMNQGAYENAQKMFLTLDSFKDSRILYLRCGKLITYEKAMVLIEFESFQSASTLFGELGDFEDSQLLAKRCRYEYARQLFDQDQFNIAHEVFLSLKDYKDSEVKSKQCQYEYARQLFDRDQFEKAREIFLSLANYKDSDEKAKQCMYQHAQELFTLARYEEASKIYRSLDNYKNSTDKVYLCQYLYAQQLFDCGTFWDAYEAFKALEDYMDSGYKAELSLQRVLASIDEIWPMAFHINYNAAPVYSYLYTFRLGDKWGIIDEELNIIVPASSDYPGIVCWGGINGINHLHIYSTQIDPKADITLNDDYLITGGHGGGSLEYIFDVDKNEVFVCLSDESGPEILSVSEFTNNYTAFMSSIVPMRYVKVIEIPSMSTYLDDFYYFIEYGYGYCDRYGNVLTRELFDYADCFSDGVAAVLKDGRWGYIDKWMNHITGIQYYSCYGTRYSPTNSRMLTPGYVYAAQHGLIAVRDETGKFGVINTSGRVILECKYDWITPLENGNFFVKSGDRWEIFSL